MAISLDPVNKIIQLDSHSVTDVDIWKACIDWSILSDNLKYGEVINYIGGVPPTPLILFLKNGWRIRPVEEDGQTDIYGIIKTDEGESPIVNTVGNFNTIVNIETPVKAIFMELDPDILTSESEFHSALDSYLNKDDWKGLTEEEHEHLMKLSTAELNKIIRYSKTSVAISTRKLRNK
jgi:hypothetical protein